MHSSVNADDVPLDLWIIACISDDGMDDDAMAGLSVIGGAKIFDALHRIRFIAIAFDFLTSVKNSLPCEASECSSKPSIQACLLKRRGLLNLSFHRM